ncbi:MAG: hypothetical protein JST00_13705 [Deltaproteobacteria bacterium]|nr:hypothetical protein [Deltaproteobacteria bacterium]
MPRWLAAVLAIVVLLLAREVVAEDGGTFKFQVPEGWIDLSPGAPEANLGRVTPDVRTAAKAVRLNPESLLYAAVPDSDTVMFAILRPESATEPLDEAALQRAANDLGWRDHFVVDKKTLEMVDGLAWGRFVGTTDNGKRFLTYLVPGRPRSLLLTFIAPPDSFESFVPTFEKAARATRGAEQPPPPKTPPPVGLGLIASIAIAMLLLNRARAKKKAAAAAIPPRE